MIGSETDEIIENIFESFLQKYQEGLEESMRGSEFAYDSVDALYYNLNKVSWIICSFPKMAKKQKGNNKSKKKMMISVFSMV